MGGEGSGGGGGGGGQIMSSERGRDSGIDSGLVIKEIILS